jgi:hypothetical protein
MKTTTIGTAAMMLAALFATTGASAKDSPEIAGAMLVQAIGTVQSVDAATHRVTIVDSLGHPTQLNVGEADYDLSRVQIGSRITSTAVQSITLTPVKHAKAQVMIPGDKQFVARVTNVDAQHGVIMLKDADNLPIEVHATDAHQAARLSAGTLVKVSLKGEAN